MLITSPDILNTFVKGLQPIDGWVPATENSNAIIWTHPDVEAAVYATPDYAEEGIVTVQIGDSFHTSFALADGRLDSRRVNYRRLITRYLDLASFGKGPVCSIDTELERLRHYFLKAQSALDRIYNDCFWDANKQRYDRGVEWDSGSDIVEGIADLMKDLMENTDGTARQPRVKLP